MLHAGNGDDKEDEQDGEGGEEEGMEQTGYRGWKPNPIETVVDD